MRETIIQKAVLDYFRMIGVYHFRAGSGKFKTEMGGYFSTGSPGVPDIIAIRSPNGVFVGLEIKSETGKQSPAQKRTEYEILNAGGEYHIIRSVADAKRIFPPPLPDRSVKCNPRSPTV